MDLEKEINEIKARNKRVESDKAWELSKTRKLIILIVTYLVIVVFMWSANLPNPMTNAVIPALAFMLSTLTIPVFKNLWLKHTQLKK